jgi:pyruvate,orthophosphate dikinase
VLHRRLGELDMIDATENPRFVDFMKLADDIRAMNVRTNAETPEDAGIAIEFGAEGIGLFRTEHMFYGKGSEEPLFNVGRSSTTSIRSSNAT